VAATTSLPEQLGGERNWDYRFCWPRDACLAASALVRLGNTGHALKLLDWMLGVVDTIETPDRLRPIYTVTGGQLPPEAEIGQMGGYGESRPVRVSNAAAEQYFPRNRIALGNIAQAYSHLAIINAAVAIGAKPV
jgi:trehalose 6-phosphate phosphatase